MAGSFFVINLYLVVMCDSYEEMSRSLVLVTTEVVQLGDVHAGTVRSTQNELEVVLEAPQADNK